MSDRRAAILAIGMLFAAGCGGGGGGGGSHPPTVPTSATTRQVIGNGGGTASVNFGIYTATVNVPSGALPVATTVSLTLYGPGHGPQTLASTARSTRALGTGATELAEVVLDTGGEALVLPVKLALVGVATPASGTSIRLAGYGTAHGFTDVDTTSLTGNTATEDNSLLYPDASLGTNTVYGFYEIPSANVLPPPTPVISISNATVPAATMTQLTGVETNGNGFPFLVNSLTYVLNTPAVGTITAGGALTTGAIDATGTVTVTDTTAGRGNPSATVNVAVGSQRPGNTGDAFMFTGTVSSTQQLTGTGGTSAQTTSGTVAVATTVGTANVSGSTDTVTSMTTETDTYPLQTVTTRTTSVNAYSLSAPATVSVVSTDATDSNGAEYLNTYGPGNGLLDVLPETTGTFGPNTAALTYTETDPGNYGRTRTIAANGSYNETGYDPYGDQQFITTNADFSATYNAAQYSFRAFTFSAPTGNPAMINGVYTYSGTNPSQVHNFSLTSWIPSGLTQPSVETDTDMGTATFPSNCAVPAKYGTSGNKIVQAITRVDAALGNLENETITTYVIANYGPVCSVMTDNVSTHYDFTGQYGYGLYYSTAGLAVETTNATETLTLSSATTSTGTLGVKRQAAGSTSRIAATLASPGFVPLAFARSRFERTVHDRLGNRHYTFSKNFFAAGVHAK